MGWGMPTRDEVADQILRSGLQGILDAAGLTADRLVAELAAELEATESVVIRVKGSNAVLEAPGARIVGRSRDEVVAEVERPAWSIRQRARMDAHQLRGDYPERRQLEPVITVVLADPFGRQARVIEAVQVAGGVEAQPQGPEGAEVEADHPRGVEPGGRGPESPPAPSRDSKPHAPPQPNSKPRSLSTRKRDIGKRNR